ncbi:hypothetical protein CJD38_16215 [Stenotrophobium rhamnosiphilum]|uniref:Uncharacterized protein n=1 Tax=Stenotrophobium rhamnosiphilum TaxID=2029166 RepID=A0A2T5MC03_9GAMM|nr:hypothetical protein CJD38_16215 [Stenotrophobium rhamnosiphilum]
MRWSVHSDTTQSRLAGVGFFYGQDALYPMGAWMRRNGAVCAEMLSLGERERAEVFVPKGPYIKDAQERRGRQTRYRLKSSAQS